MTRYCMDFDKSLQVLVSGKVGRQVDDRTYEFKKVFSSSEKRWFSELCFCLLTANAKQKTAATVQMELGADGFLTTPLTELVSCLLRNKHRFHNNKSKYIVQAREHFPIREKVLEVRGSDSDRVARDWLAKYVKGFGLKEASHFLRNVGLMDVAIIDRHILRVMHRYKMIRQIPKTVTPKIYFQMEKTLSKVAKKWNMPVGKLDLYMWYMNTNEVLK